MTKLGSVFYFLFWCSYLLAGPDLTFVQINDTSEIADYCEQGGIAKASGLVKTLQSKGHHVLFIHSGDLLGPSASSQFLFEGEPLSGRPMIEVLNAAGLHYATFGNHDFNLSEEHFVNRISACNFTWVSSNTEYVGKTPWPNSLNPIHKSIIYEKQTPNGLIKIGFFGLTTDANQPSYIKFEPYLDAAKRIVHLLRPHCDMIVAITHLSLQEDKKLADYIHDLDLIIGAHDHENMLVSRGPFYTPIAKADGNALTAYVHEVSFEPHQNPEIISDLKVLDKKAPSDPFVQKVVEEWYEQIRTAMKPMGFNASNILFYSLTPLEGKEEVIRYHSNELTELINSSLLKSWPTADAAIFNCGIIRLPLAIAAGPVTEFDIFRILPFPCSSIRVEMRGHLLKTILKSGLLQKGTGSFIHTINLEQEGPLELMKWAVNSKPIDPNQIYKIVLNDYLLSGKCKGFEFLTEKTPGIEKIIKSDEIGKIIIENKRK
jgi:5'-nucleotidase/UDP-sugar diphosphatase